MLNISIVCSHKKFDEILANVFKSNDYIPQTKWYLQRECVLQNDSLLVTTFLPNAPFTSEQVVKEKRIIREMDNVILEEINSTILVPSLSLFEIKSTQTKFIGIFQHINSPWMCIFSRIYEAETPLEIDSKIRENEPPTFCTISWNIKSDTNYTQDELTSFFNQDYHFFWS